MNSNTGHSAQKQDRAKADRGAADTKRPNEALRRPWLDLGACGLVLAAVFIVFWPCREFAFVNYDDDVQVMQASIARGLDLYGVRWAFTHFHNCMWHPLTTMSHMLDCSLYGQNPAGHHVTNVALHGLVSILLFVALRCLRIDLGLAAFTAFVFAVHPLHVEPVVWVADRKDLVSGVFFMLTLIAYTRYVGGRRHWWSFLWVALFFQLGLMGKTSIVTLPFLLLLLDIWPLRRLDEVPLGWQRALARLALEKLPLFLLSGIASVVHLHAQNATGALNHLDVEVSLFWRIGNAVVATATYVYNTLIPIDLAVFYPHPGTALPVAKIVASLVLLLAVTALVLGFSRRHAGPAIGWLWFGGMLLPSSGIIQTGVHAMADRYVYLPQIGLCLAMAMGVRFLLAWIKVPRLAVVGLAAIAVFALMVLARSQATHWRDSETLWAHTIAVTAPSARTHCLFARWLMDQTRWDEAETQCRMALTLQPDNFDATTNLGNTLFIKQRSDEALPYLRAALRLKPDSRLACKNLAAAYASTGRKTDAIATFSEFLLKNPDLAEARSDFGQLLFSLGETPEALRQMEQAVSSEPRNVRCLLASAQALRRMNRLPEAMEHFRKAMAENPESLEATMGFASLASSLGPKREALEAYAHAVRLVPSSAEARQGLGFVLGVSGRVDEAIHQLETAEKLAEGRIPTVLLLLCDNYAAAGRSGDGIAAANRGLTLPGVVADSRLKRVFTQRIESLEKKRQ